MRRPMAGTGWKMNHTAAQTAEYAERLKAALTHSVADGLDIFVLPPFTALHAAQRHFAGSPVAFGGQNMHWDLSGAWTGEISAPMLVEAGCRYVELAHSERLAHFGETYELVRRKLNAALATGLTPILCLGETGEDKRQGRAVAVLAEQLAIALADQPAARVPEVVLAYEPRWAIGAVAAAAPEYVTACQTGLRTLLAERYGDTVADTTRVIHGGSVTPENGEELMRLPDVDGLFVGRAAWSPEGFARIVDIVHRAAQERSMP